MKKIIFLFVLSFLTIFAQGQIRKMRAKDQVTPLPYSGLIILAYDINTFSPPDKAVVKLQVGKDTIQLKPIYNASLYFVYKGALPDSMLIEVQSKGYQPARYMFYTHLQRPLANRIEVHLTREGEVPPNMIVVVGNRVEVTIEGQTTVHDLAALRQSRKEDVLQVLTRLPGLELTKSDLKVNGKLLERLYINGELFMRSFDSYQYDVIKQMKKFKEKEG